MCALTKIAAVQLRQEDCARPTTGKLVEASLFGLLGPRAAWWTQGMTCERSQEFACRRWLKEIAPTRTHGIVTGLPREETIRPPDSPGFRSWVILPNGDTLHTNDIFYVRLPPSYVKLRYVFRRARIESDEVTAWGPIGSDNDGWRILGIQRCKERVS